MGSLALRKTTSMLLNLPREVLSQVVAVLTPDDLINTALSCKGFYGFCKVNGDLERHTKYQKAYTVLKLGLHGMDPIELLEKLNKDWRVAYYVKAVHFQCPKTGPLFPKKPHGDLRYLMNTTAYAEEAMCALLAPLLLLLPNLGRLRFIDFSRQPPGLKEVVRRVDPRTALTKLQVVEFVKSERPTEQEIEWREDTSSFKNAFNPWGFVYSVHTLRAENIIWNDHFAQRHFQITTLELKNCSIDVDGLERFLVCCTNLKRFTYDWNLGYNLNGLFDESGLFCILTCCCANTLEYVRLTGALPPVRLMFDRYKLTGLGRMKRTHLSLDLFVDPDESWEDWLSRDGNDHPDWRFIVLPLHEFLPPSTEDITIDFRKKNWLCELKDLLLYLVSSKISRSRLPLLKSVVVESDVLTADEIKKLMDYWQDQSTTTEIGFRVVNI